MSRHPAFLPRLLPSLERLLGTRDPRQQVQRVMKLAEMSEMFLLITFNPMTGDKQIAHSAAMSPEDYQQALALGLAHLRETQAAALSRGQGETNHEPERSTDAAPGADPGGDPGRLPDGDRGLSGAAA